MLVEALIVFMATMFSLTSVTSTGGIKQEGKGAAHPWLLCVARVEGEQYQEELYLED